MAATRRADATASAWIEPARQQRSRRTLRAILDAARQLLNEKPFDEITIAGICQSAGCSPPALYQRFRDKEALLHAIHEQFTADVIRLVEEFIDPEQWRGETIQHLMDSLVRGVMAIESRSGGLRTTAVRRSASDEQFASRIRLMRDELYSHLADVLDLLSDQTQHPDPRRAARFLVRMIQGTAVRHYEGQHLESFPPDHDELVEDLSRAALAYLGAHSNP